MKKQTKNKRKDMYIYAWILDANDHMKSIKRERGGSDLWCEHKQLKSSQELDEGNCSNT